MACGASQETAARRQRLWWRASWPDNGLVSPRRPSALARGSTAEWSRDGNLARPCSGQMAARNCQDDEADGTAGPWAGQRGGGRDGSEERTRRPTDPRAPQGGCEPPPRPGAELDELLRVVGRTDTVLRELHHAADASGRKCDHNLWAPSDRAATHAQPRIPARLCGAKLGWHPPPMRKKVFAGIYDACDVLLCLVFASVVGVARSWHALHVASQCATVPAAPGLRCHIGEANIRRGSGGSQAPAVPQGRCCAATVSGDIRVHHCCSSSAAGPEPLTRGHTFGALSRPFRRYGSELRCSRLSRPRKARAYFACAPRQ